MEKKQFEMGSFSSKIFIETIGFFAKTFTYLSSLASHPLFSIFITLYSLILLYFPRIFLDLILSPVLISTGIILSTLLRLGSIQRVVIQVDQNQNQNLNLNPNFLELPDHDLQWVNHETEKEPEIEPKIEAETETDKMGCFPPKFFVEWNVRAPLEVIYEEYEGQEEEEEDNREMGINGLGSLARYYPESDTGSSSDGDFPVIEGWDSPENMCFRWEEEDKEEGLIEIELGDGSDKRKISCEFLQVEEENLIEIEISLFGSPKKW